MEEAMQKRSLVKPLRSDSPKKRDALELCELRLCEALWAMDHENYSHASELVARARLLLGPELRRRGLQ
jgi:hypothetical protein